MNIYYPLFLLFMQMRHLTFQIKCAGVHWLKWWLRWTEFYDQKEQFWFAIHPLCSPGCLRWPKHSSGSLIYTIVNQDQLVERGFLLQPNNFGGLKLLWHHNNRHNWSQAHHHLWCLPSTVRIVSLEAKNVHHSLEKTKKDIWVFRLYKSVVAVGGCNCSGLQSLCAGCPSKYV